MLLNIAIIAASAIFVVAFANMPCRLYPARVKRPDPWRREIVRVREIVRL